MNWAIFMQVKSILETFVTSSQFEKISELFTRNRKKLTFIVLFLLIAIILVFKNYYTISRRYELTLQKTLRTISSSNYSKGFEAYILSNLTDIQTPFDVGLSNEYKEFFKKINETLSRSVYKQGIDLKLRIANTNSAYNQIITDNHKGFLFLPKNLLRIPSNQEKFQKLQLLTRNTGGLDNILKIEKNLREEVYYTQQIDRILEDFSTKYLIDNSTAMSTDLKLIPSQVYFITQSGINRIFKNEEKDLEGYYAKQFPSSIYFPARPYYSSTFDDSEGKQTYGTLDELETSASIKKIKDFFNVTGPYLDLGGNGIVYTLSRGIILPDKTRGVICFDFRINDERMKSIFNESFDNINAKTFTASMRLNSVKNTELAITEKNEDIFERLFYHVRSVFSKDSTDMINSKIIEVLNRKISTPSGRTQVLGGISVFDSEQVGELVVTIPISGISYQDSSLPLGNLMVARVDLDSLDKNTNLLIIISIILLFLLSSLIIYAWSDDLRRRKEYQNAFNRVDEVMRFSPVAYARLDNKDNLRHYSLAFCELLGYYENGHLDHDINSKTFASLCAKNSKSEYEKVQKKRQLGYKVEPYDLIMVKKNGIEIEVKVISATVPSEKHRGIPETFGIVISKGDLKHNEYLNYVDIIGNIT